MLAREVRALKLSTGVRIGLLIIMLPMIWLLSFSNFDRIATFSLVAVYLVVLVVSLRLVRDRRRLTTVGLGGVALDIMMIAALPLIWYTSLGGSVLPAGITLKTSVTLFAILLISLNTLAIRPLYPCLVTAGTLMVHAALLGTAISDQQTQFTSNYLHAYTTAQISSRAVITKFVVVTLVGGLLTLLTLRARNMVIEAVELPKSLEVNSGVIFLPTWSSGSWKTPNCFG